MKTIIAGGRDFKPEQKHIDWLIELLLELKTDTVVYGMAKGADTFGAIVGAKMGLKILNFPADWNKFGKSAGYKRNEEMAKVANSCILFPGGKGTQHMKI